MISDRLKKLRLESGLTQQQVATELGVSQPNYRRWEAGERIPKHDTLVKLANYFQVSIDYLLENTDIRGINHFVDFEEYLREIHVQSFELGQTLSQNLDMLIYSIVKQKNEKKITDIEYQRLIDKVSFNILHLLDKQARDEIKPYFRDYVERLSKKFKKN